MVTPFTVKFFAVKTGSGYLISQSRGSLSGKGLGPISRVEIPNLHAPLSVTSSSVHEVSSSLVSKDSITGLGIRIG